MPEPVPHPDDLPTAVEEEVLAILDGDEHGREDALRSVLARHAGHAPAIRHWLAASGVPLPSDRAGDQAPGTPGLDADGALPQALGPYVLLEQLGRGGFGTVFRGEQQQPIRRPVAVKVMNAGMDSRELLARFAAEREALNRMDHPGIARLLDAGTTGNGRPFFVMELVAGPTLLAHCRKRALPVRARVRLFLMVLDAMQHAHQKAMLHRDLSANNVLVADPDGAPQPKIIDFGIAKSLSDPLLHGAAMTLRGTLLGTPEYMSPEQAAGAVEDLDTRADVYALGVQLYELLTDALPIPAAALRARGIAGIAETVRTFRPALPSAAAPRSRAGELRGDLDAIVGKAIAKDRDERYGSVGEFAADLRRHLADEPVAVASPSTWYRLRKFVRRNRAQSLVAAIAGLLVLAAMVSMVVSLRMARDAAAEAETLRQRSDDKADAGFLLLANEERLAAAIAAERELGPPWPEHLEAYEAWLRDHGLMLRAEREKLRDKLAALDAQLAGQRRDRDAPARRHLASALGRLERQFDAFHAEAGPLHDVQRRRELLVDVIAPAAAAHASRWRGAAEAIARSDGVAASRDYRGLRVTAMPGLVPLGADPTTGLHEFVDLASHAAGYPLPMRDAAGALACDAGTGVVFVLLPAGRLEQGAHRNRPGVDRNDELASDDELAGTSIALDAFLIARHELTVAQWSRLTGQSRRGDEPRLPCTDVDWREAVATLHRFGMQLPTEAQWEYACRANARTPWCTGDDAGAVATAGWFDRGLQPVGRLLPNAFGLHDMHGNAAEWCADEKLPYEDSDVRRGDGLRQRRVAVGAGRDERRVVRGGAWHQGPSRARTTARDGRPPETRDAAIGIRPMRVLRP